MEFAYYSYCVATSLLSLIAVSINRPGNERIKIPFIKSNLVIPGRHIELINVIGQGTSHIM